MAKKKKRRYSFKGSVIFYSIYFILIAAAAVAVWYGKGYLTGYLEKYEASQPKYAAQDAFCYFSDRDFETLYAYDTAIPQLKDTSKENYVSYMQSFTEGKTLEYSEVFSQNPTESRYVVTADGENAFFFTMGQTGEQNEMGVDIYKLSSVESVVIVPTEYRVSAPNDSTVYVNDIELTQTEIIGEPVKTKADGLLPEGAQAPTLVTYSYYMGFTEPTVKVVDRLGREQTPVSTDGRIMSYEITYDEVVEDYKDPIQKYAVKFADFSVGDVTKGDMRKNIIKDSPAYTYVNSFDNTVTKKRAHSSTRVENFVISDFYIYNDKVFSCKVDFDYTVNYTKADPALYKTSYVLYFLKSGNTYKIYNLTFES